MLVGDEERMTVGELVEKLRQLPQEHFAYMEKTGFVGCVNTDSTYPDNIPIVIMER